jgi:sulfur carrier protein ThiS
MASATVKLYASLTDYLPPGTKNNMAKVTLPSDKATIQAVLAQFKVPMEQCHLVLLNGLFITPSTRADCIVEDGDTVAVWPPVAGG